MVIEKTGNLNDIRLAAQKIGLFVRRTPVISACHALIALPHPCHLFLKLEHLQLTGSFKIRGATNKLLHLSPQQKSHGIVAASGGNNGRAVAYLGWRHGIPTTIYLPHDTPDDKVTAIEHWKVKIKFAGHSLDEATVIANKEAEQNAQGFIHPFADWDVINGQGTIGLEILEDIPQVDIIIVPIGGGGLISGIGIAAKTQNPNLKIIGVEPKGCPTLFNSLNLGHVVPVPEITTHVGTLAIQRTSELNYQLVQKYVDQIVLVSDDEMLQASQWLWQEFGTAAELSGAAAIAGLLTGQIAVQPDEKVCAIISGMGAEGTNL